MLANKSGKMIFGVSMTAAEKKAFQKEFLRQFAEYDRKHSIELDAMILWRLYEQFGFGPKKLKQFFDGFVEDIEAVADNYEMQDTDDKIWLFTHKLKQYGIDVEQWRKESGYDT